MPPFSVNPDGLKFHVIVMWAGFDAEKMPPPTVEATSPLQFAQKPVPGVTGSSWRVAVKGVVEEGIKSGKALNWLSVLEVRRFIPAPGNAQETSRSVFASYVVVFGESDRVLIRVVWLVVAPLLLEAHGSCQLC